MKTWKPTEAEISSAQQWGIWEKEISEFDWFYEEEETCYILEGEAEVTDQNGESICFKTGDMVTFEQGLTCIWKIIKPIRKRYRFG